MHPCPDSGRSPCRFPGRCHQRAQSRSDPACLSSHCPSGKVILYFSPGTGLSSSSTSSISIQLFSFSSEALVPDALLTASGLKGISFLLLPRLLSTWPRTPCRDPPCRPRVRPPGRPGIPPNPRCHSWAGNPARGDLDQTTVDGDQGPLEGNPGRIDDHIAATALEGDTAHRFNDNPHRLEIVVVEQSARSGWP